jgi:hypothetical protein
MAHTDWRGLCCWCAWYPQFPTSYNSIQSCALKHKNYKSHDEGALPFTRRLGQQISTTNWIMSHFSLFAAGELRNTQQRSGKTGGKATMRISFPGSALEEE